MKPHITKDELMLFLDGELDPEAHERVRRALENDTELTRELAIFRAMKGQFHELSFDAGDRRGSVWARVDRQLTRPVGWVLLTGGVLAWLLYGTYLFATGPSDAWEKLATGAVVIGVLLLLGSVIAERYRASLTDPYRDVHR